MVQAVATSSVHRSGASGAARRTALMQALGRKIDARDPEAARDAAAMLTSQLFFAPMLAEMRKLPFGKEFGNGGRMEEAFGEQLDMRMADIVARSDRGLTAQVAAKLTRKNELKTAVPAGNQRSYGTYEPRPLIGGEA
jgi:hypothetical protein